MRRYWVLMALVALALAGRPAAGADPPFVLHRGQTELNFSFVMQEGEWGSGVTLSGRAGYLLTPHHEVGPIGSIIYSSPDQGRNYWGGTVGAFYRYNLGTYGRFVIPYAGAAAMWAFGDARQADTTITQLEAGVRLMLSSTAAVNLGAVYQRERTTYAQPLLQRTFAIVAGVAVFTRPVLHHR